MVLEIRPVVEEELNEFKQAASNSLAINPSAFANMRPEFTLCAFEEGKVATTYAAWPFIMRFNGTGIPVSAVSMVSTRPIHRRRGNLRRVITTHFRQLYDEKERPIAILYASLATIYQRYGYAIVSTQNSYNIEPRYLDFAIPNRVTGTFHELTEDEFPLLIDLYRHFRENRTGFLHRGRAMWEAGALAPPPSDSFINKIVYRENGQPLGYLIYTLKAGTGWLPNQMAMIRDLVWLNISAYRAFWNYFRNKDLVANIIWARVPGDDPLPHLLLEPRMLHTTTSDGLLGRIVDVGQALTKRCYDEEGTLTFEIIDELCPWNQGRWKLETSSQGSFINHTAEEPQVIMPVSTLAMLAFGQISAIEAARMERLELVKEAALPVWDRIMRTRFRPACTDFF